MPMMQIQENTKLKQMFNTSAPVKSFLGNYSGASGFLKSKDRFLYFDS
jgi:hypothetical protein